MSRLTSRLAIVAIVGALLLVSVPFVHAQEGRYDNIAFASSGRFAPGVNVAVCNTITTTGASLTSDIATLTFSSNPITLGFVAGNTLTVSGFTGGDTYFNGSWTIAAVSTSTISYADTAANGSASSNGSVYQTGNSTQACAPLATLYTSSSGATASGNPIVADGLGNYGFWASPNQYEVQIYGPTVTTSLFYVSIACVPFNTSSCGALLSAGNAWTGSNTFDGTVEFNASVIFNDTNTTFVEGAAPSGAAGREICNGVSSTHTLQCSYNGGTAGTIPLINLPWTWTGAQTFGAASVFSAAATFNSTAAFVDTVTFGEQVTYSSGIGTNYTEGTEVGGSAGSDICYGDSAAHALKCSNNNGPFGVVELTCGGQPQFLYVNVSGGDYSTAQTSYTAPITGLAWTVPASTACNIPFTCSIVYGQTVGTAPDTFGFGAGAAGTAPSNAQVQSRTYTAGGTTPANQVANTNYTGTTTSTYSSFTPGSDAALYNAEVSGFIEQPSGLATTYGIYVATSNASDPITIKRDSFCRIN